MRLHSTITTKGRTTIPVEVRRYLDIGPGNRLGYEFADGKVMLVSGKKSALDFAGVLHQPGRKPVSVEAMDTAIGEGIARRYGRSRDRN